MATEIERVLERHSEVVEDGFTHNNKLRYSNYAVTTLRGGVGKSTLSFNLAYELARHRPLLIADLCAQCNMTEVLLRDEEPKINIIHALAPVLLGPAFGSAPSDVTYRVSQYCDSFKSQKPAYILPGSPEMFAFPSQLYQQLQMAHSQRNVKAVKNLLLSLKTILDEQVKVVGAEGVLMDTSPFYAGGTHLAWCASDAVIIPVRVDEHSLASLELTLDMMENPGKDFQMWNERAGGLPTPDVAAIVMTMAGSKSQMKSTPDRASRMYIERAIDIALKHPSLFGGVDPTESIVVTDDFVSSGRISGARSIPIAELRVGKFHSVEGKRLQVNGSVLRYQNELAYLASVL